MAKSNGNLDTNAPPRPLGKHGKDLWDRVCNDFLLADECARETLAQICEAEDHTQELCAAVKKEGSVKETEGGYQKAHPAFQMIRQNRIFIVRALERLRNQHKPNKMLGRPARSLHAGYDPYTEDR